MNSRPPRRPSPRPGTATPNRRERVTPPRDTDAGPAITVWRSGAEAGAPSRKDERPRRSAADRSTSDRPAREAREARPPRRRDAESTSPLVEAAAPAADAPVRPGNAQRKDETRIHGVNACLAVFRKRPEDIVRVYIAPQRSAQFAELLRYCAAQRRAYHIVPEADITRASESEHHEGICLLIRKRPLLELSDWLPTLPPTGPLRLLALDHVGNPHNLGAILRSAAHFGVTTVLLNRSAPIHAGATARTAEGGLEPLTLVAYDAADEAMKALRSAGLPQIATRGDASTSIHAQPLPERAVVWFGEERHGLSATVLEQADLSLCIPGTGLVESLNVSVATAVFLAEWCRSPEPRRERTRSADRPRRRGPTA